MKSDSVLRRVLLGEAAEESEAPPIAAGRGFGTFDPRRRNDRDIAAAAKGALDGLTSVPRDKVRAVVEGGWITLSGVVDWNYQREATHASVRALAGVRSVINRILVSSRTATPEEVRKEIRISLRRSKRTDVEGIIIDAEDGKVTLRGKLRSCEERDDAGIAAWFAPGVSEVVNDLVIKA
jgi:osmotically-inducible protein OsmY